MNSSKVKTGLRILLGALWLLFGLNGFFQFLPMPPPAPAMGNILGALFATGYFFPFLKATETILGLLLVSNSFTLLALIISAPITINIVLMHGMLDPSGIGGGAIMILLNIALAYLYRDHYREVLKMKV
jgi:hypothetical protein